MSSSWRREITAVFLKELHTELRGKNGLITAGLFSVVSVVAIAFAAYNHTLDGSLAAGLLWVAILFATVVSLPRIFLAEEEQGTMDLLRLMARPHAVFWGKSLFALVQSMLVGGLLSAQFLVMIDKWIYVPWLFLVVLLAGCASLSGAVTLCSAIVAQTSHRAALAAAIAVPALLPVMMLAVTGMRVALGAGFSGSGNAAAVGLVGYATATLVLGPSLFALVWKS